MPKVEYGGNEIEFPDDMSKEEIGKVMALHQGEESLMDYHKSNIASPLVNPDGSSTTVWITGVTINGKIYAVPGYDRDARRKMTGQESAKKWYPMIKENPNIFPHHDTPDLHNQWAQEFHKKIETTTE